MPCPSSLCAHLLLLLAACASPAPTPPPEEKVAEKMQPPDPPSPPMPALGPWQGSPVHLDTTRLGALIRGPRMPAGPVVFDPATARLALGAGGFVRYFRAGGMMLDSVDLEAEVRDLAFAPDGSLWVMLGAEILRLDGLTVACRVAREAEWFLEVSPDGSLAAVAQMGTETGAWGQVLTVDKTCAVTEGPLVHDAPSAVLHAGARTWTGTTAVIEGGPKRVGPPAVSLSGAEGAPRRWEVLAAHPEVNRVASLVAGAGHLFVLGDSGAWEIWADDGSKRIAEGSGTATVAVGVPGTDQVALGRDLIDLKDGTRSADVLPAPAITTSPDGSAWVLGEEASRGLWIF